MEEQVLTLNDYIDILKRRRRQFILPAAILFVLSLIVAVAIPSVYQSRAIILIEQQDIPKELVASTVTSYAGERIQIISQQVMTTTNLTAIIEKYGLYTEDKDRLTREEIIEGMQEDINLEMISADVVDPRSGRPTTATIAFSLSYDSKVPELAQKVANELVSLYLNENLKTRKEKAQEASSFLTTEAQRLSKLIGDLEQKLADFKQKNVGKLPELVQLNLQVMDRTERELLELKRQSRSLAERRILLQAELAQINPYTNIISSTGERILGPADRLKSLEAELAGKKASYSADHPDIIKMRREIESLRKETGQVDDESEINGQLQKARGELAASRKTYAADHPDIRKLERMVASLEDRLKKTRSGLSIKKTLASPDNPAYIQLKAQLDATNADLNSLRVQQGSLKKKLTEYEKRITETPQVEREYKNLSRGYENAVATYQSIKAKLEQAQLAEQLEKGAKGERFSLIEPPLLPEKPDKPNRLAILFLGFVLSFAGGLGGVAVSESMDNSVRGTRGIAAILGAPPLVTIPYIDSPDEIALREQNQQLLSKRNVTWLAASGAGVAIALLLIHFAYKPLDVLWFVLLRKLGM